VTSVYCGQTVGWIKMPLATEVRLGPGDIVLDGTQLPPKKGYSSFPRFGPCLLWPNGRLSQQLLSSCRFRYYTHTVDWRQLTGNIIPARISVDSIVSPSARIADAAAADASLPPTATNHMILQTYWRSFVSVVSSSSVAVSDKLTA